ncbi:MAG: double-strand break repair helicase AddA [Alphaproteobacteria bacterium]|nr:double-strand break repair helicase AddA [Alphaproteobacteria bacterium]
MNASDPRRSAWVAANAGAGKTHTLANRVTRLLLAGARPEGILCLTYTKAAAAEMAGRLFDLLGKWSMLPDKTLAENITEIGAEPGGKAGLQEARRLFAKALETPGGLKIQTIHAFCQYVLARFPLEAGVPASFRVLDERSASELMAQARARVLERAGRGDLPRAAAVAYLATHMSDMRLEQLLDAALGADRDKLDRFLQKAGDDWTETLRLAHGARADDTPESVAQEFCRELARDEAVLRQTIGWLAAGSVSDAGRAQALAAALESLEALEKFDAVCGALLTKDGGQRAALATKKLAAARPDLLAFLQNLCARVLEHEDRRRAAEAAALADAALTVIAAVRDEYAAEKRLRSALDYDDLIAETDRLLRDSGAAWVLFKLDAGIDHVLIDEAQDTSARQWEIVQSLTQEFFAGQGADRPVRTLFAVGDEKQSIFSFQGADPAQFDIRRRFFEQRARDAECEFSNEPLPVSRRSAPQILKFVDETFATAQARDGLTFSGAAIRHEALRKGAPGCVELWPTLKPSNEEAKDPWHLRPVDVERESGPVARLAEQIADRIKGWLTTGACLPGHRAPIKPGDIMILLPRREPFGSEIIRRLKERNVPVAGADRLRVAEQMAVMDLMALGRFVLLPEDDLNLAALLRSPLCGLSEDDLYALAHGRRAGLWEELSRREAFGAAHAFLAEMRERADFAPPFEFFAHALTACGGRKKLLKRLGAEAGDPIDEFLSLALQFENAETPSLQGFLHWVERGGADVKRDMERGRNEVRVMTVHGAKGLEADIVILPDTTRLPTVGGGTLLYTDEHMLFPVSSTEAPARVLAAKQAVADDALREHRRLLYVAMTRAKDRLIVCGFENKRGNKPESWHSLAERAAKALGIETVQGDTAMYAFGDMATTAGKKAEVAARREPLPDWATQPAKAERPAPWLIRPSMAAGMGEPALPSPLQRATQYRRGLLIHAMLARLPDVAPERRTDAALKFLRARGTDAPTAGELAAETLAVLDDSRFAPAFGTGSRAEVALVADLPEIAPGARVHGRVDRLAVTDDAVLIVDFKTNRPPPACESDVPRVYATQMALYRAAAARIFPGKRIDCALVWTDGPRLMALSEAFLEAETTHIRARLDPGGSGS